MNVSVNNVKVHFRKDEPISKRLTGTQQPDSISSRSPVAEFQHQKNASPENDILLSYCPNSKYVLPLWVLMSSSVACFAWQHCLSHPKNHVQCHRMFSLGNVIIQFYKIYLKEKKKYLQQSHKQVSPKF